MIPTAKEVEAITLEHVNKKGWRQEGRVWFDLPIEKVPEKTNGIDFNREFWQYLTYYQQGIIFEELARLLKAERRVNISISEARLHKVADEGFNKKVVLFSNQRDKLQNLARRAYDSLSPKVDKYGEALIKDRQVFNTYSDHHKEAILIHSKLQQQYLVNVRTFLENFFGALGEERAKKYLQALRDAIFGKNASWEEFFRIFAKVSKLTDLSKCKVPPLKIPSYWDLEKKYKTN